MREDLAWMIRTRQPKSPRWAICQRKYFSPIKAILVAPFLVILFLAPSGRPKIYTEKVDAQLYQLNFRPIF
jgi:hypothetical protein